MRESAELLQDPEVKAALRELRAVARVLGRSKARTAELEAKRKELFVLLRNLGVRQATMARAAGVSSTAVFFAFEPKSKKQVSTK